MTCIYPSKTGGCLSAGRPNGTEHLTRASARLRARSTAPGSPPPASATPQPCRRLRTWGRRARREPGPPRSRPSPRACPAPRACRLGFSSAPSVGWSCGGLSRAARARHALQQAVRRNAWEWTVAGREIHNDPSFPYTPKLQSETAIVRKQGIDILHDPLYNKAWPRRPQLSRCKESRHLTCTADTRC